MSRFNCTEEKNIIIQNLVYILSIIELTEYVNCISYFITLLCEKYFHLQKRLRYWKCFQFVD